MTRVLIISIVLLTLSIKLSAKTALTDTLPAVFRVGEYSKDYEILIASCSTTLSDIDMISEDGGHQAFLKTLARLELFAHDNGFDIRGVKIWINFFWDADGRLKHISYYPKKNSRNVDFDHLHRILKAFLAQYQAEFRHRSCFSHIGSASFPTHAEYLLEKG